MPFTDNYVILKTPNTEKKFTCVYYPSTDDNENDKAFAQDLHETLVKAHHHATHTKSKFFLDVITFGVAFQDVTITPAFEDSLHEQGFAPDDNIADLWITSIPLSWQQNPRLRTLQERLQKDVYIAHPAGIYDIGELVAEYNTKVLKRALSEILSITLDNSPASLATIDDLITMREDEEVWHFNVFSEALLVACGDYTGEVIRTLSRSARWVKQDRPLVIKGATFAPRDKVLKLYYNGPEDSLQFYVNFIQHQITSGEI